MPVQSTKGQAVKDHTLQVVPKPGGVVSVSNDAGDTLYYSDNSNVSQTVNQGSLAATQAQTFSGATYLRSAGTSYITVTMPDGTSTGAAGAPAFPATTVPLVNPTGRNVAITISAGTVTAIAIDGATTGITSGTVILPQGKAITVTYTGSPTWTWVVF